MAFVALLADGGAPLTSPSPRKVGGKVSLPTPGLPRGEGWGERALFADNATRAKVKQWIGSELKRLGLPPPDCIAISIHARRNMPLQARACSHPNSQCLFPLQ